MQRITITIDDALAAELDALGTARGYQNRSEIVRDLVRAGIVHTRPEAVATPECVAVVVYVYEQETRDLPQRLTSAFRDQHDLSLATMRVSLDHETCLEVAVLRGRTAEVEGLAERIVAERGVRHGRVVLIPAEIESEHHAHGERQPHAHQHIKVR